MARKRRSYSAEFRAEAVRLVLEENLTRARVASDLGIPESSVSRWVKQAQIDAGQGKSGELTTDERSELARLRREVRILKQEREILKKAALDSNGQRNTLRKWHIDDQADLHPTGQRADLESLASWDFHQ